MMKKLSFIISIIFLSSCATEESPIAKTWVFSNGKEYNNNVFVKDTTRANCYWFFLENKSFVEKLSNPNPSIALGTTNNGKWSMKDNVLTIDFKDIPTKKWTILELTESKLQVKELSDSAITYEWNLIPASL